MSTPTTIEEEELIAIDKDLNDSFKHIPVSESSIKTWKIFLADRDKKQYSDSEVLEIIKNDPNPEEYDEKDLVNKTIKFKKENQRSDLVKSIILNNGGELEENEDEPIKFEDEGIEDDT